MPTTDSLGRPLISDLLKQQMSDALKGIPDGKRGALVLVADTETKTTRLQVAAKIGDHWKVAGGAGYDFSSHSLPAGYVKVVGAW